jgi:propionyl-CoA carboxylase alpha chain
MNTRLQVEHPVTEEVTGLDLVALQLRVARGDQLGLTQEDIQVSGHAIEVRLYAEDPAQDYLPTPGLLHHYEHPVRAGLRYEDGVSAPAQISPYYDPMIAKVVARADSRVDAASALASAMEATQVHGVRTNRDFLAALLREPDFLAGETRTNFLELHPHLLDPPTATPWIVHLAAAVSVSTSLRGAGRHLQPPAAPGFRPMASSPLTTAIWHRDGTTDALAVGYRLGAWAGDSALVLEVDGDRHELTLRHLTPDSVTVRHAGVDHRCTVRTYPDGSVWVNDPTSQTSWRPEPRLPDPGASGPTALGPVNEIPGTVVRVDVAAGDVVAAGQKLVVIEAMKMEHAATAAVDGIVEQVHVAVGQYVDAHTVLVTLATEDA